MSSHRKVLSNAFAQFVGKVLTVVASLTIVKIVTGVGPEFYGNYVTAYEFLAFFGIIADAGLFAIAVREMSKIRDKGSTLSGAGNGTRDDRDAFVLSNIFSMRLILIFGVMLLAGAVAQLIPSYPPVVKLGIWITAISMGLTIVAGTLSSILQARMKIQYFAGSMVLGKILLAGIIYITAWKAHAVPEPYSQLGTGMFYAMLWAGVVSNVIFAGLVTYFVSREVKISLGFDFSWWRKIFRESLPYGLALILQTLYLRIDLVLISILLGARAVGVYGVSTRILESFLVLGVFFGQAILPRLSAEEADSKKSEKTLTWGMQMLSAFSLPVIIGVFAFAPQIIELLSTPEFLSHEGFFGSDGVLKLLVITVFFAYFNQLFIFTLVSKKKQNYLLIVNLIAVILNTGLNLYFLPRYGIISAALSTIFCEVVVFTLLLRQIMYTHSLHIWNTNFLYILCANAVLWAEIYLTPLRDNLWQAFFVGGLTYLGLLYWQRRRIFPVEPPAR